ncbi:MAG: pyrimidine/purine nucleotide monophosphate nucleosidase domain-containing protein, partial [Shewanella sp.]
PFPLVLTGPIESADYFMKIDEFIGATLGSEAQKKYQIIIDNPAEVARVMKQSMEQVKSYRRATGDAYQYQWALKIEPEFQLPFTPSHEVMANLNLHFQSNKAELAANLRKAFSGIVAGNVKSDTIKQIERFGPFQLKGDPLLMEMLDNLLSAFVVQHRMKLPGSTYIPCYQIVK